jgi:transcriptional regulator with XRE-family HTH domain
MKDRILKFLTKEGISPAHFADEIGVQRSSVSHILSGRNNPSYDFIYKILERYKNLNSEWLLMGIGEIYKKVEKNIIIVPENKPKEPKESPPVQHDLFSEMSTMKSEEPPVYETPVVKMSSGKVVEKIIVFYSDKSFTEFLPSS